MHTGVLKHTPTQSHHTPTHTIWQSYQLWNIGMTLLNILTGASFFIFFDDPEGFVCSHDDVEGVQLLASLSVMSETASLYFEGAGEVVQGAL